MAMEQRTYSHPERMTDEAFLDNHKKWDFPNLGWLTKRCGKTAYDIDGNVISDPDIVPVFVIRDEVNVAPSLMVNNTGNVVPRLL